MPLPALAPAGTSRPLRVVEVVAGLCSSGLLVVGVLLLGAKLLAPGVSGTDGFLRADGPLWWRVLLTLGVGAGTELLRLGRRRYPVALRWVLALLTVAAVGTTLWLTWWS